MMKLDIEELLPIAVKAGEAIMQVYNTADMGIEYKQDSSPLTLADKASHDVIVKELHQLTPGIPVLSEEGSDIPYEERSKWEYFWCVDPLDGTKEFIKRNGEFTVNIALIYQQQPIAGIIYIPVTGVLYYADEKSAKKKTADGIITNLQVDKTAKEWIAVGSRSHASEEEAALLKAYPVTKAITVGSSLKFCMIAEGKAHIYYRNGPTMEWDTAAGHAIITYSGGQLTTPNGDVFLYNKPSLLNGSFLCKVY